MQILALILLCDHRMGLLTAAFFKNHSLGCIKNKPVEDGRQRPRDGRRRLSIYILYNPLTPRFWRHN